MKNKNILFLFVLLFVFTIGFLTLDNTFVEAKANEKNMITIKEAKEIALNTSGGGEIAKFKRDNQNVLEGYEFVINNNMKHKIVINAETGIVAKYNQKISKTISNHIRQDVPIISSDDAEETALAMVKGKVIRTKLISSKKGERYYIVVIDSNIKHKVQVDLYNNKIVKYEQERIRSVDIPSLKSILSVEYAENIVKKEVGGGIVINVDFNHQHKNNTLIYDIDIVKDSIKYEYKIDARDGRILEYEIDYDYNKPAVMS